MKTLLLTLVLCLFIPSFSQGKNDHHLKYKLQHVDFIKRQHQNKIHQQHAQWGHKKGTDKIAENQSVKPHKPLFYDCSRFFLGKRPRNSR